MARAIIAPGVEQIMENLFTHHGDHARRYDIGVRRLKRADVVSTVIQNDRGTAIAYVGDDGRVECNPPAARAVEARALLLLVREGAEPGVDAVRAALECR